jgi:hypothetical protein
MGLTDVVMSLQPGSTFCEPNQQITNHTQVHKKL